MTSTIGNIRQLGAAIRARRKEAHLTTTRVAALARVSRRLLTETELGKRLPLGDATQRNCGPSNREIPVRDIVVTLTLLLAVAPARARERLPGLATRTPALSPHPVA